MMLDALGILFRRFGRHPYCQQQIHHDPVAGPDAGGEGVSIRGQKHPPLGFGDGEALALQAADGLESGGVGHANPAGDVGGAGFAAGVDQVRDQLDIIFQQGGGLRGACFAEPSRLGWLGR